MGIRFKIISGFVILASMLLISGVISIYELTMLGRSVNSLIHNNYRSIDYSKNMMRSLEGHNRAMLLHLAGNKDSSVALLKKAEAIFLENLAHATNNLTIANEGAYVDSIRKSYHEYAILISLFLNTPKPKILDYMSAAYGQYTNVNNKVEDLLTINQENLQQTAVFLENSPHRTLLPGLVVIITSLAFTIIFNYMINYYFASPIIRLTKGINDYVKFRKPFEVIIETKDELLSLKESIMNLISDCKAPRKNE